MHGYSLVPSLAFEGIGRYQVGGFGALGVVQSGGSAYRTLPDITGFRRPTFANPSRIYYAELIHVLFTKFTAGQLEFILAAGGDSGISLSTFQSTKVGYQFVTGLPFQSAKRLLQILQKDQPPFDDLGIAGIVLDQERTRGFSVLDKDAPQ